MPSALRKFEPASTGETDTLETPHGDAAPHDHSALSTEERIEHFEEKLAVDETAHPENYNNDTLTEGGADTTDVTGTFSDKETFIPVTRFALQSKLTREEVWEPGQAATVERFFALLASWRHQTYAHKLLDIKEAYAPFSPDRDTVRSRKFSDEQLFGFQKRLVGRMKNLLDQANYREISHDQLDDIFQGESAYGLDLEVDISEFEELMIYCRGATNETRERRRWQSLYLKKEEYTVPIYQRLFMLLKIKSEEQRTKEIMRDKNVSEKRARRLLRKARRMMPKAVSSDLIYLKMFKNIPTPDLEMMFPNTTVKFRLKDKLLLGATAGGGTIFSIVSAVGKLALIFTNPIKAIGAVVGIIGVGVRQIMKFFNQKNQYMMVLAQNLYFHSLADNRGVLALLTDRAEEEDVKEDWLLYCVLAKEPVAKDELYSVKLAIEQFLHDHYDVTVEYDIYDAYGRLRDDGLVTEDANGVVHCKGPEEGCNHISQKWMDHIHRDSLTDLTDLSAEA